MRTCRQKTAKIEVKSFQLFEFISLSNENDQLKEIDVAPKCWIFAKENQIYTKFMPPPYDSEKRKFLNQLISSQAPAPDEWPGYPIMLRGHACKYCNDHEKNRFSFYFIKYGRYQQFPKI